MDMWKKHAVIIFLIILVSQPIVVYIDSIATSQMRALLWSTNFLALAYGVYLVKMTMDNFKPISDKLKEMGVDPPTYENFFATIYKQLKPFMDASKKADLKAEDIEKIMKTLKKFSESMDDDKKLDIDGELKRVDAKMKEGHDSMEKTFKNIYDNQLWICGSGQGSTKTYTKEYRKFLQDFLKSKKIESVLDVGCGDWQFSECIDWNGIQYLGIDVVPSVIENNKQKYTKKNIRFKVANICKQELSYADLIIVKDVLQHWSNKDIIGFFGRLKKFKYVMVVNDSIGKIKNEDIKTGDWRFLDVRQPPFNIKAEEIFRFDTKTVLLMTKRKWGCKKHGRF